MTKHLPMHPTVKAIYDYVRELGRVQGSSARQWREGGNLPMANYLAGASNICLEILDFIERHP